MKNKFLTKIMTLVAIMSSMFIISACDIFQKEVNISRIDVKEGTIPESIMVGEFDNAGIKLVVTYDDESIEEIAVTSEMIPEEYQSYLTTPGIYEIEILFRGLTTEITVKIVEESIFTVNFYNGNGLLVSSQQVKQGESATEPTSLLLNIVGFELVAWDVDFTNIQKDTKVYAIYTGIENTITDEAIKEEWLKSISNHKISNSVSVWDYTLIHSATNQFVHSTNINYHYDEETQTGSAQHVCIANNSNSIEITNYYADWYEVYSSASGIYNRYENYQGSGFGDNVSEGILSNGTGFDIFNVNEDSITISYQLCNNKLIYIVEETRQRDYNDELRYNEIYTYKFTEDGLISVDFWREDLLLNKNATGKLVVEYGFVEFDDTLIPEEVKNANN